MHDALAKGYARRFFRDLTKGLEKKSNSSAAIWKRVLRDISSEQNIPKQDGRELIRIIESVYDLPHVLDVQSTPRMFWSIPKPWVKSGWTSANFLQPAATNFTIFEDDLKATLFDEEDTSLAHFVDTIIYASETVIISRRSSGTIITKHAIDRWFERQLLTTEAYHDGPLRSSLMEALRVASYVRAAVLFHGQDDANRSVLDVVLPVQNGAFMAIIMPGCPDPENLDMGAYFDASGLHCPSLKRGVLGIMLFIRTFFDTIMLDKYKDVIDRIENWKISNKHIIDENPLIMGTAYTRTTLTPSTLKCIEELYEIVKPMFQARSNWEVKHHERAKKRLHPTK